MSPNFPTLGHPQIKKMETLVIGIGNDGLELCSLLASRSPSGTIVVPFGAGSDLSQAPEGFGDLFDVEVLDLCFKRELDREYLLPLIRSANMCFIVCDPSLERSFASLFELSEWMDNLDAFCVVWLSVPFSKEQESAKADLAKKVTLVSTSRSGHGSKQMVQISRHIRAIVDLLYHPGVINVDFSDVRALLKRRGIAAAGWGTGTGENRTQEAVQDSLDDLSQTIGNLKTATKVLINLVGGHDISMTDFDTVGRAIFPLLNSDAMVVFGITFDLELDGDLALQLVVSN